MEELELASEMLSPEIPSKDLSGENECGFQVKNDPARDLQSSNGSPCRMSAASVFSAPAI